MLDNLKNLASLPGLMAKAGEMKERMAAMQAEVAKELGALRVDADSGGGMVTATCNGKGELVSLKIDPNRLDPSKASAEDLELLEDLIVAAVAAAQQKATQRGAEVAGEKMSAITADLGLPPGLMDQLGKA